MPHKHKLGLQMCLALLRLLLMELGTQTQATLLTQQTFNHYLLYKINFNFHP